MTTEGTLAELGEDGLIQLFASQNLKRDPQVVVPNGDDAAAFLVTAGEAVVTTTDTLVEGVHFDLSYTPPHKVGRKLMAVNLSDLAAMGARPEHVLFSLCLPSQTPIEVAREIAGGAGEMCRTFDVGIIGGNTTRTTGPMILTAVLFGAAPPAELLVRSGAKAGDVLFVTGTLGNANAGLRLSIRDGRIERQHPLFELADALYNPTPRVAAGRMLAKNGRVRGACDVSDGLARDVVRLLEPSGLGARIEASRLPISPILRLFAAEMGLRAETLALEGGEDYELLFAAAADSERSITETLAEVGLSVARIGTVTTAPEFVVEETNGVRPLMSAAFAHFGGA